MQMHALAPRVREASIQLAGADAGLKNRALTRVAEALTDRREEIIRANKEDLRRCAQENLAAPLLKRLAFGADEIADVVDGIRSLVKLEDPVGKTLLSTELDEGLELYKVTCPIGVIGVIFESRPDALVQISTLCLKSGNGVLLKGGSEAMETNRILAEVITDATREAGLPAHWLALLETREDVGEMLKMDAYIDLIIPRGSNEFVRYIMDNSRIPVMGHADGICHCFVAADADLATAVRVVVDSKTQYVAVCNAVETLLVDERIAAEFLPDAQKALEAKRVKLAGCARTRELITVDPVAEDDWKTEHLDYRLSIRVVGGLDEAIEHINTYGSGHTDSIITKDRDKAARFMEYVDSGNVFWNCSTRFSDGFRYGFGAEVGISTGKVHSRGPVGLEGLVIYKYKVIGDGHIVAEYADRTRSFTHKSLDKDYPF